MPAKLYIGKKKNTTEEKEEDKKTLFRKDNVFLTMIENKWKKIIVDKEKERISITTNDGKDLELLIMLSTNDFKNIFATILDQAFLDISIKRGTQRAVIQPRFGDYISEKTFKIEQVDSVITINKLHGKKRQVFEF
jgi:hypothetical protein